MEPANDPKRRLQKAGAFTLVELLVVIGVIALLVAMLVPGGQWVFMRAAATDCANNLRMIGQAVSLYAGINSGMLPNSSCPTRADEVERWWLRALSEYADADELPSRCPSDGGGPFVDWSDPPTEQLDRYRWSSYATNGRMDKSQTRRLSRVKQPASTIYMCETPENILGADHVHPEMWLVRQEVETQVAWDRHGGRPNFLFLDWHVEGLTLEETWHTDAVNLWNPKKAPHWSTVREY